jgi:hypothetical protein
LIMGLVETVFCVGATRHIPVINRVARKFSRQGLQGQMEYDPRKKKKEKQDMSRVVLTTAWHPRCFGVKDLSAHPQ